MLPITAHGALPRPGSVSSHRDLETVSTSSLISISQRTQAVVVSCVHC